MIVKPGYQKDLQRAGRDKVARKAVRQMSSH